MNGISGRLSKVRSRLRAACESSGRDPEEVTLLAVSKMHPAASVRSLFELGQEKFGENRLQEALVKQDELDDLPIEWHFIGPVQSNKTRDIAARFDWVQSVDRNKVLQRLSSQRPPGFPALNICLQVNIDSEPQKAGVLPHAAMALAEQARALPGVRLRGLMSIPRFEPDPERSRASFVRLSALFQQLCAAGFELDTLSMGMSADLEVAISEGSTMVRVGTDLLGQRPSKSDTP